MKKYILSLAVLSIAALTNHCLAQAAGQVFTTNGKGTIFRQHSASDVDGTPNLYEGWMQGKALGDKGIVYDNILLKYDVVDDLPLFAVADTDDPKTFNDPVKSFVIKGETEIFFSNGFPGN